MLVQGVDDQLHRCCVGSEGKTERARFEKQPGCWVWILQWLCCVVKQKQKRRENVRNDAKRQCQEWKDWHNFHCSVGEGGFEW